MCAKIEETHKKKTILTKRGVQKSIRRSVLFFRRGGHILLNRN